MKIPRKIRRTSKYSNIFLGCLFAVATFMLLSIGALVTGAWFTDSASSSPEGSYAEMHFGTVDVGLSGTGTNDEVIDITVDTNTCYYDSTNEIYYMVAGSSFTINDCGISIQNTSTVPIYYTLRHGANYYVIENGSLVAVEGADGLQSLASSVVAFSTGNDLPYLMPTETTKNYVIAHNWVCTLQDTANVGSSGENVWTVSDGTNNITYSVYSNVLPTGAITANGLIEVAKDILSGIFEVRAIQANNVGFATAKAELMPQVAVLDYDGGVQGANAPLNGYNLEVVNGVVTLPSANPTKENYTFAGWEIDYAVNGADVVDGDAVVSNGTTTLTNQTSSAVIRAKWEFAGLRITMQTNSQTYNITADVLEAIANDVADDSGADYTSGTATLSDEHYSFEGELLPTTLTIGDTITLPTFTYDDRTYSNVQFRILGFNHDTLADSTQKAGITFQCTTALFQATMNSTATNVDGFGASLMATTTLPALENALPSGLVSKIKTVKKSYNNGNTAGTMTASASNTGDFSLWLLSAKEVFNGCSDVGNFGGDVQYKYYTLDKGTERKVGYHANSGQTGNAIWWFRSAHSYSSVSFVYIKSAYWSNNINHADELYGVVPCFCI